jgi:pentatricopeptide repeat protein
MICLGFISGKFDEAEREGRMAIRLEPLSAIDHADLAWTLYVARKFEESLAMAKAGIDLDNNSFLSHRIAGLAYMGLNRYEEAIETFKYLMKISDRNQHAINNLIWAYCNNNNLEEASELMNELIERSSTEYIAGTYAGISAAYLGDLERAISFLEKAYFDHDPILMTIRWAPHIPEQLRTDARFQKLLKNIGFPD